MTQAAQMLATYPADLGQIDREALAHCIQECFTCAQTCTACADACLSSEMVGDSMGNYTYAASNYMKYPGPEKMIVVQRNLGRYPRRTVLFGDGRVESIEPARWGQVQEASSDAIRKRTAEDARH